MKTLMYQSSLELPQKKRGSRTFWLSEKKYASFQRTQNKGSYHVQNISEKVKKGKRYVQVSLKHRFSEEAIIACGCGFRGDAETPYTNKETKNATWKLLHPRCPICGNEQFEEKISSVRPELSFCKLHADRDKLSLSFGIQQVEINRSANPDSFQEKDTVFETKIRKFQTKIRLTYNYEKKALYMVIPKKKFVRNISYGNVSDLQRYYLNAMTSSEEGRKVFLQFIALCLKKAGIHDKKRRYLIEKIKKENAFFKRWSDSFEKVVFPLLTLPQLQAMDNELFVLSVATAPKSIKHKIKAATGNTRDIYQKIYGFSSKRLLRYCAENPLHDFNVHLFRPLFRNDVFLMDFVSKIKDTDEFLFENRDMVNHFVPSERFFSSALRIRKEFFPFFKHLKARYKEERVFRNELMKLLESDVCEHHLGKMVSYIRDIFHMERLLLQLLPPERLPVRSSLVALHDAYVREINANQVSLNSFSEEDHFAYLDQEHALEEKEGDTSIRLATSTKDLAMIGRELNNCVRGYGDDVKERKSLVLVMEEDEKPTVCIELSIGTYAWKLMQASTNGNGMLLEHQRKRMKNWVRNHGIQDSQRLLGEESVKMNDKQRKGFKEYKRQVEELSYKKEQEKLLHRLKVDNQKQEVCFAGQRGDEINEDDLPF